MRLNEAIRTVDTHSQTYISVVYEHRTLISIETKNGGTLSFEPHKTTDGIRGVNPRKQLLGYLPTKREVKEVGEV